MNQKQKELFKEKKNKNKDQSAFSIMCYREEYQNLTYVFKKAKYKRINTIIFFFFR